MPFTSPNSRPDGEPLRSPRRIAKVLSDRSTSFWLKSALSGALARDPVDAARDAEVLSELLAQRADSALREQLHTAIPMAPARLE
jgi:hypothetical protein